MSELSGGGGEFRATIQITRKATGKVETVELVGRTTPKEHEKIMKDMHKENDDGGHTLDGK